jgi:uncharacterized protein (TIGR03067 family)
MQTTLLIIVLALGAPAPREVPKPPVVGTWLVLSQTQEGTTSEVTGNECWTFTADGKWGGHKINKVPTGWQKYTVNEKARPCALDVIHEYRTGSQTDSFIFEIDGDTLTMCTRTRGRPESISAKEGSGNTVYVLKRVKAKD